MALLEVKEISCNSCKGIDHKRSTSKLCPNSYWGQKRSADRLDILIFLKEKLKKFEDFILQNDITLDKLAPVFCSNWMEFKCYRGEYSRMEQLQLQAAKKILFNLHYDIILEMGMYSVYVKSPLEKKDILNIELLERTKIIFGIVGSNAGDILHISNHIYKKIHHGTITLLKLWGLFILEKPVYI